ncbi:MAG: hypothetical protein WAN86_24035 [Hyphomicrobiaceae bacterium]
MPRFPRSSWAGMLVRSAMLAVAVVCASTALATPALAAKLRFGPIENLTKIQDTDIKSPKGEALYLGYLFTHHSFVLPYYTTDDGYVLGVVGAKTYYPLEPDLLKKLQVQKLLPNPLPPYSISWIDYLFGYILWFTLVGVAIAMAYTYLKQRRQSQVGRTV